MKIKISILFLLVIANTALAMDGGGIGSDSSESKTKRTKVLPKKARLPLARTLAVMQAAKKIMFEMVRLERHYADTPQEGTVWFDWKPAAEYNKNQTSGLILECSHNLPVAVNGFWGRFSFIRRSSVLNHGDMRIMRDLHAFACLEKIEDKKLYTPPRSICNSTKYYKVTKVGDMTLGDPVVRDAAHYQLPAHINEFMAFYRFQYPEFAYACGVGSERAAAKGVSAIDF